MEILQTDYTDITTSSNNKIHDIVVCILKLNVLLESIAKF